MVFTSPHYKQKVAASPMTAISKTPTSHQFKVGGKGKKEIDPKFAGPCCGGHRQVGDFSRSSCMCCPKGKEFKAYLCQYCRMPLALSDEQRRRLKENKNQAELRLDAPMLRMVEQMEKEYLRTETVTVTAATAATA